MKKDSSHQYPQQGRDGNNVRGSTNINRAQATTNKQSKDDGRNISQYGFAGHVSQTPKRSDGEVGRTATQQNQIHEEELRPQFSKIFSNSKQKVRASNYRRGDASQFEDEQKGCCSIVALSLCTLLAIAGIVLGILLGLGVIGGPFTNLKSASKSNWGPNGGDGLNTTNQSTSAIDYQNQSSSNVQNNTNNTANMTHQLPNSQNAVIDEIKDDNTNEDQLNTDNNINEINSNVESHLDSNRNFFSHTAHLRRVKKTNAHQQFSKPQHGDSLPLSVSNSASNLIDNWILPTTVVSNDSDADSSTNRTTVESNQNSSETSSDWQSYNITSPDFSTIGSTDVSYSNSLGSTNNSTDQNTSVVIVETVTIQPSVYPSTLLSTSSVSPQ